MVQCNSNYENIQVTRENEVGRITLDSTSKLNALNSRMAKELFEATTGLTEEEEVRCIVLTGHGEAFSAGADLEEFDTTDERDASDFRQLAPVFHNVVLQLHQAPKPVITGVNGVAVGAGFSMAILGDLVLIQEGAYLQYGYPRIGLTGNGGSTFSLPRLVGLRRAREIALLNEPIKPPQAVDWGLATEVVSPDLFEERLMELAQQIAQGPTIALGRTRKLLSESFDRGLADQMARETDMIAQSSLTEDFQRGVRAFQQGEDPEFVGR